METREQSSHGKNHRSSSSLSQTPSVSHAENSNESPPVFQSSDQSRFGSGTYIVQVPKDQVYHVPPPENAILAENHRRNNQGRSSSCCCGCSFCSFMLVFVIVLIGAIVGSVVAIFLICDNPSFSIKHFLVKRLSVHHKQSLEYDIKIKVRNPNKHHGILYDQDSDVTLSSKQKEIAAGKFPNFDQGPKDSTVTHVTMHGSSSQLPKDIAATMNSTTHSKSRISLFLSMNVPVKLKLGALNVKSKKIDVSCNFLVDRFDKDAHLVTQECTAGA